MMYRFRSPATGDLLMMKATGDQVLQLIGHEVADQGIIEPEHLAAAIARLEQAAAASAADRPEPAEDAGDEDESRRGVSLRQRLWPMIEMLRRAQSAGERVVWGV